VKEERERERERERWFMAERKAAASFLLVALS
jgi:hypothetical protein